MNILETLQFMKPNIKVLVWENDIDRIEYNEAETFRPTKSEILAVNQSSVVAYTDQQKQIKDDSTVTLIELLQKVIDLETKIDIVKADVSVLKGK